MGFGPQFADLDGDGKKDLVSGSWPGEVYCFKGQGGGTFAAPIKLGFEDGTELNVGKAASVAVGDWDGDGDLDLLIGVISGEVWFVPRVAKEWNKGFGPGQKIQVGSKDLRVPGGDAGPALADFDRDGITDLLVGAGNGSVLLYRRVRKGDALLLQPPQILLPRGDSQPKDPKRPGQRSKLQVLDWNGDGRMDLLVGDFSTEPGAAPKLSQAQQEKKKSLLARRSRISAGLGERIRALSRKVRKALGYGERETIPPTRRKAFNRALLKAYAGDPAYNKLRAESLKIAEELAPLSPKQILHGRVRLFLQRG